MNASTSQRPGLGSKSKTKSTSGWAAFDFKQRQKDQGLAEVDSEPYPLLSGPTAAQSLSNKNGAPLAKPFSSVVLASMNFPPLMDTGNEYLQRQGPVIDTSLGTSQNTESAEACQKLCSLHPWADEGLIKDVLAGVNNNVDEALSLLGAMVVSENNDAKKEIPEIDIANGFTPSDSKAASVNEQVDLRLITNDSFKDNHTRSKDDASSRLLMNNGNFIPLEPESEWGDDDVYLTHRKDAIRKIRSASRYSKAANDAYVRGDHLSAHLLSLKSQEEWHAAEKLNAEAAKEILNIRNGENDTWTLDLHGLHATEAVLALRDHLQRVESLVSSSSSAMPNEIQKEPVTLRSAYVQSLTPGKMEKFGRQHQLSKQRLKLLQVITGKGNHSRGAAALPSAMRSFLIENGYHFDETRPGVIMIRPKFRQRGAGTAS